MASSRAWANAFNIGCTFVVAYALLALAVLHAHKARHGGVTEPHHPHHHGHQHGMERTPNEGERRHGPCPLEHFAWLALVTGLTGLVAGCTMKRRWMYIFPVALLLTETYALVHISRGAVRAVHECAVRSERVLETVSVDRTDIAPGVSMVREKVAFSKPFMDVQARDECVDGVRHAVLLSCMIIGAICSALMCCGSRLTAARARELQNSTHTVTIVGTACVPEEEERRPLKQDPLEDDEDIAHGNVVIIRRV